MKRYRKQAEIKEANLKEIQRRLDEAGREGLTASEISREVGLSRWTVTKHLNELRDQELVGKIGSRFYARTPGEWDPVARLMKEDLFVREMWKEFESSIKGKRGIELRRRMTGILKRYFSIYACCAPYAVRVACQEPDIKSATNTLVAIWDKVMIDRAVAFLGMIYPGPKEAREALEDVEKWMIRRLST